MATTKFPRHRRRWQKNRLRALLSNPIKAYKIPEACRLEIVSRRLAMRTEALFALYEIPEEFPLIDQWEMLARSIAGEHFRGYQVLEKGLGGPNEERREKQRHLFREFQNYRLDLSSRSQAAVYFLQNNRNRCADAGFSNPKSFAEAAAKFRKRMAAHDHPLFKEQK